MKECTICKIEKDIDLFQTIKNIKGGRMNQCKECRKECSRKSYKKNSTKEKRREKYLRNKESSIECTKKWHENNKEKRREYRRNYCKKRREDSLYKLSENISNLIRMSFYNNNFLKSSKSFNILGCNIQEFKKYIEYKFEPWMNFYNYGKPKNKIDKRWVFDHIIPISTAKSKDDLIKLNHYSNFQPLEFIENIKKSNKLV